MGVILQEPKAREDIEEVVIYLYLEASEKVAGRFLDSIDTTFQKLSEFPFMGRVINSDEFDDEIRIWKVENFESYLIIYQPITNGIKIIRVLHGRRDIGVELNIENL